MLVDVFEKVVEDNDNTFERSYTYSSTSIFLNMYSGRDNGVQCEDNLSQRNMDPFEGRSLQGTA